MIVGINFTKLSAEKSGNPKGKINVNNNVSIKSVEEVNLSIGKENQSVLKINFEFMAKYDPDIGRITFNGDILFLNEIKKVKEMVSSWKKDKKLPKEIMNGLLNAILGKCNVKALILSQEVNLPSPIPLPKVQVGDIPKK